VRSSREQRGFAHVVLLALVVALGVLLATALLGAKSNTVAANGPAPDIDVAAASRALDPSVTVIDATLAQARGAVAGTGLVVSASGTVLTNNHVIAGADDITAQVGGTGRRYAAHVVGYDVTHDIAVLQLEGAPPLTAAPIGNPALAHVGDSVVALGNARGRGGAPATAAGTITALGQRVTATDSEGSDRETLTDMIQIAARVEPGDSGGPVVDAQHRVIGLTAAATTGTDTLPAASVSGFAIPIDRALAIAHQITAGRRSATVHIGPRAILGVQVKTVQSTPAVAAVDGAVVGLVENSSPARAAGLRADDVIVSVDGADVSSLANLNAALDPHQPGDVIQLGWTDGTGQKRTASVTLLSGPPL
jgi:S1-C subfamily serine protease